MKSDPTPWFANKDDCNVYLTLVFKGLKFSGDAQPITTLTNDWLISAGSRKSPGYFLMVVEQATTDDPDRPSAPNDMWEVFRLRKDSSAEYFQHGRFIEVDPLSGAGSSELGRQDKEREMKALLATVAQEISAHFNCYQPKPIPSAEKNAALLIAACTPRNVAG